MLDQVPDDRLAEAFRRWARHAHGSPLYALLSNAIADDPRVLEVAARIQHTPRQNVLFAAVQYLLTPEDDLARYYRSRTEDPLPAEPAAAALFSRFVVERAERIVELGRTRYTQTNEPRRGTILLPWLSAAARELGEPVHLVEVGASAGLNLCFDSYTHRYSSGVEVGKGRPVLRIEVRGRLPGPIRFPLVAERVGLDLHPLDLDDPDDLAWALALIWPEQEERRRRFLEAVETRKGVAIRMVEGDASATLGGVLETLPPGPVLVWHSFAWNQFRPEQRRRFDEALRAREGESVHRIGFEFWNGAQDWPEVRIGLDSGRMTTVARAHAHGEWVEPIRNLRL